MTEDVLVEVKNCSEGGVGASLEWFWVGVGVL